MDIETAQRFTALEQKLEEIHTAVEKTRQYVLIMLVAALLGALLPILGVLLAIPTITSVMSQYQQLGL
jgi:hypothetical protein